MAIKSGPVYVSVVSLVAGVTGSGSVASGCTAWCSEGVLLMVS